MSVEMLISNEAWLVRVHLGSSVDEQRASLEEAFAALFAVQRIASRYQLPERAESLQCAFVGSAGRCQNYAVSPLIFSFLCGAAHEPLSREACWCFTGRLCEQHIPYIVVPPPSWWPAEREAALV